MLPVVSGGNEKHSPGAFTELFINKNKDYFQDQEYDPVGPVEQTTQSGRLSSLAASGV
jgi:hypothetical protein